MTLSNEGRAQILAEKFFPRASLADLSDIASGQPAANTLDVPAEVTPKQLEEVIRKLPNGRAPGPDGIPNEILKVIAPIVSKDLAHAISKQLESGMIPNSYKESTTVVLRKERKKDYSLPSSYRPVALEDTLAKVMEKIVATRIAETAEEHALLSWNQMGARKKRSTTSAIDLLTACVETAWGSRNGCMVSMLSLDISGAFDHVSKERLLWIL